MPRRGEFKLDNPTCYRCHVALVLGDNWSAQARKQRRYSCKACRIELYREWVQQNPDHNRRRYAKKAAFIAWLKEIPCIDCNKHFPPECMDFDHVRGTKKHQIGLMLGSGFSLRKLQTEVMKCELVCACCHRIRTKSRLKIVK